MKRVLYTTILLCIFFLSDVISVSSDKVKAQYEICDEVEVCIDAIAEDLTEVRDIITSDGFQDGANESADDLKEINSINDADYSESSEVDIEESRKQEYVIKHHEELNDDFHHEILSSKEDLRTGILHPIQASDSVQTTDDFGDSLNSSVYKTVNHYFCSTQNTKDSHLILYGTKSWTFPKQDVNLTLSYPTVSEKSQKLAVSDQILISEEQSYIITGFKVILYVDGIETKGYLTRGGILKNRITLSFTSRDISSLLYEFWLYGTPRSDASTTMEVNYYPCS